ncbi:uncharacterized protein LOC133779546 [Humulus lupulus]|uniref:uncharacterized protein LOC133779546 n=1 Tax=Humulus lupulus TaxID=3486 RepID=UPI002B409414|nr:uncharacterized protein LOC133779546 [Humulus lupulus]
MHSIFREWLQENFDTGSVETIAEAGVLRWEIWRARNNLVWNQNLSSVLVVVFCAKPHLNHWLYAQLSLAPSPSMLQEEVHEHWSQYAVNSIKINVDTTIFDDIRKHGLGDVARDCDGHFLEAFSVLKEGKEQTAVAEAISV